MDGTYTENVLKTEVHGFDMIRYRLYDDNLVRFLHGTMGLATETYELITALTNGKKDEVNIIEELGDLSWYMAIICDALRIDFNNIIKSATMVDETVAAAAYNISSNSFDMLDMAKKLIFYGRGFNNQQIAGMLTVIVSGILRIAYSCNVDYNTILERNIEKLRARYPNKFTEQDANNRDLNVERKTLES